MVLRVGCVERSSCSHASENRRHPIRHSAPCVTASCQSCGRDGLTWDSRPPGPLGNPGARASACRREAAPCWGQKPVRAVTKVGITPVNPLTPESAMQGVFGCAPAPLHSRGRGPRAPERLARCPPCSGRQRGGPDPACRDMCRSADRSTDVRPPVDVLAARCGSGIPELPGGVHDRGSHEDRRPSFLVGGQTISVVSDAVRKDIAHGEEPRRGPGEAPQTRAPW